MKFYCLKNCSTCRRVRQQLEDQGIAYEEIDIREQPPTDKEILLGLSFAQGNPRKIMNTSGQLYREKGLKDQLDHLDDQEIIGLLSQEGMLVKRPFMVDQEKASAGGRPQDLKSVWGIEE